MDRQSLQSQQEWEEMEPGFCTSWILLEESYTKCFRSPAIRLSSSFPVRN